MSVGGDSIGGTISVDSPPPEFAASSKTLALRGQAGTSYRSKGTGYGAVLQFAIAGESMSMTYNGSISSADNYTAKGTSSPREPAVDRGWLDGNEVGSSRYEAQNHVLAFALRQGRHLVDLKLGLQIIPYQGFPISAWT